MKNKVLIPIIGAPSAGKGTRIKCAQERKNYTVISTSDLIKNSGIDTSHGELIDDKTVEKLMREAIENAEGKVILDGFPRTKTQAEFLMSLGVTVNKVINVYLDEDDVMERSQDRLICPECHATYTKSNFNPPKKPGICDVCGSKLTVREDESKISLRYKIYEKNLEAIKEVFREHEVEFVSLDAKLKPEAILDFV